MIRLLLLIAVISIGYDAVVHNGFYTRQAWSNIVGATNAGIENARDMGRDLRSESRSSVN